MKFALTKLDIQTDWTSGDIGSLKPEASAAAGQEVTLQTAQYIDLSHSTSVLLYLLWFQIYKFNQYVERYSLSDYRVFFY